MNTATGIFHLVTHPPSSLPDLIQGSPCNPFTGRSEETMDVSFRKVKEVNHLFFQKTTKGIHPLLS